jgi:hypothetical protein
MFGIIIDPVLCSAERGRLVGLTLLKKSCYEEILEHRIFQLCWGLLFVVAVVDS